MTGRELLAPCSLYCGVCGILMAHRDNNDKFKERLASFYGVMPEDIVCKGCLSDQRFKFCETCSIRSCTEEKGLEGCHQCDDFPCSFIDNFPVPVGKKVILRAVPTRREIGTEKWVEQEEARYLCPNCGYGIFRGAKRCRSCKEPVDLD
ncbi:MAG: DUF3795 domain-containing protein [Desulfomonilaceae bacterium]|nr:DUF3795 domain-containing protein [Desulfomonilaceae bacterium]